MSGDMRSNVLDVLQRFHTDMTCQEMQELIVSIKRAAVDDEQQMKSKIHELKEGMVADLNERDKRDARLQHYMFAHNVPLDEHVATYRRNIDNVNSLYSEAFGCPITYELGRTNVEQTAMFQRLNK